MKRVCAYCNTIMDPGESPDSPVTHGICDTCSRHLYASLGIDISKNIEMFDAPVILLNPDARILEASGEAARFIGKPSGEILGSLAGDALGCSAAGLPGGCGNTIHCSGCVIRDNVRKTYDSGEPIDRCPAVFLKGTPDNSRRIELLISTRKSGSVILLRVEPVGTKHP